MKGWNIRALGEERHDLIETGVEGKRNGGLPVVSKKRRLYSLSMNRWTASCYSHEESLKSFGEIQGKMKLLKFYG